MRPDERECKRCPYPGEDVVRCPHCRTEIDEVLVEEWDDGGVTAHCPACHDVVTSVVETDSTE